MHNEKKIIGILVEKNADIYICTLESKRTIIFFVKMVCSTCRGQFYPGTNMKWRILQMVINTQFTSRLFFSPNRCNMKHKQCRHVICFLYDNTIGSHCPKLNTEQQKHSKSNCSNKVMFLFLFKQLIRLYYTRLTTYIYEHSIEMTSCTL